MSTRSIIVVTGTPLYNGKHQTIRLYKHSDGYPTGNLPVIKDAIKKALDQKREQDCRFGDDPKERALVPEHVAALIIGESASVYGFGAKVDAYESDEATYYSEVNRETLGNQADLEWIYLLDINKSTLNIFGGRQTDVLKGKTLDPLAYVDCLREECKSKESFETKQLVREIESLGFKVNPGKTKKPKSKPKLKAGA